MLLLCQNRTTRIATCGSLQSLHAVHFLLNPKKQNVEDDLGLICKNSTAKLFQRYFKICDDSLAQTLLTILKLVEEHLKSVETAFRTASFNNVWLLRSFSHDFLPGFVNVIKSLGFVRELVANVIRAENTLKIHPLALYLQQQEPIEEYEKLEAERADPLVAKWTM